MKKQKPKKERPAKYEDKTVVVDASFKDIMKAAVKDATKKSAPKKP